MARSGQTTSAPADGRKLVGTVISSRYRVKEAIGAGAKGTVYAAWDLSLERDVALKVPSEITEDAVKRFLREGRAGASIAHPNVCAIYDFGPLQDGTPFLVMERLIGEPLGERLARDRRIAPREAARIIEQILDGLDAAHMQGIVHRDLKPGNVFLAAVAPGPPTAKILDFGASTLMHKAREQVEGFESLTKTGTAIGTPIYMCPEQVRGVHDLDARVDLYSCGVLLYEMIVGVPPFNATSRAELFRLILGGVFKPASAIEPSVGVALDAVIARALASDRANRYTSAQAFREALDSLDEGALSRVGRASSSPADSLRLVALQQRLEEVESYYVESANNVRAAKQAETSDIPIDVEEEPTTLRDPPATTTTTTGTTDSRPPRSS